MTQLIDPVFVPSGSWLARFFGAIQLAYRNYKTRRLEGSQTYHSWIEDIDRLARRD